MKLRFTQKIQLFFLQFLIFGISIFEFLGALPERLFTTFFRGAIYAVILVSLIYSFDLDVTHKGYLESFIIPTSAQVLGAGSVKIPKPRKIIDIEIPYITATSVYAFDITNNSELLAINADLQLPPASTTKLMTALVALENHSLNDSLTIPVVCTDTKSQEADLPANSVISVRDLLHAALIRSAGDAVCTLALSGGAYSDFVSQMNQKAQVLGMTSTNFTNPIGLDDYDSRHISSARDLFLLSKEAVGNPVISEIVAKKDYVLESLPNYYVSNTNYLLWQIPETKGIKTGTTPTAGEVLSYLYDDGEKEIIIVVMGSQDRFGDTVNILNWILQVYSWD